MSSFTPSGRSYFPLALSSERFTHGDSLSLALAAARSYRSKRPSDTRTVSQRLSPLSILGLPLGFLG